MGREKEQRFQYLLIWRWCWMTMFFSWMVSSRAVARDLRSEIDWGVTGKLQPFSSDSKSSFTAIPTPPVTVHSEGHSSWDKANQDLETNLFMWDFWPCLAERTPVRALLLGLPLILEFFLLSRALWNSSSRIKFGLNKLNVKKVVF